MGDHPLEELLADWPADDRLDELLWGGDLSASVAALERAHGLLRMDADAIADAAASASASANAGANAAAARRDEEGDMKASASSPSSSEEQGPSVTSSIPSSLGTGAGIGIGTETGSGIGPQPGTGTGTGTGATPLLSSRWLNWENPGAATKLSAGLPEDTQELRRLKTRDAMRRSRQRQRDQLQTLRGAVAELEAQYSQLCLVTERDLAVSSRSADLADALALSKRLGAENLMLQTSIQRQELWRQQLNVVMESRAINAADGRSLLGRGHASSDSVLSSASPSAGAEAAAASGPPASVESLPFRPDILDPLEAKSVFGFRPLSQEDVKDVILANARVVRRVQRQLLLGRSGSGHGEDELAHGGGQPVAKMDVFGWDVRQRVRGSHMDFVFTKRFPPTVSVSEVMHKSWVGEMHLKGMQMLKYDTKRLEVLQEVDPNAYVLGRDVHSPDSTPMFRSTIVRYRMESPPEPYVDDSSSSSSNNSGLDRADMADDDDDDDAFDEYKPPLVASGFVIGMYSINPDSAESSATLPSASSYARELASDVLWADLSYAIEFRAVADARSGHEQFVEIRWAGTTDYKSPFHAYRNTADKISQLLHWELQHIAPVAQIVPASP